MGNTSNFILVALSISLMMSIYALSIQSIDPNSDLLLGNKLFGRGIQYNANDNVVYSSVNNNNGVYSYSPNTTSFDNLGSSSNSIVSTSSFAFPDWIRSGWSFITGAGRTYVNLVGAPYTIVTNIGLDNELAVLIGSFFGIFTTFIMLNWILGRDN